MAGSTNFLTSSTLDCDFLRFFSFSTTALGDIETVVDWNRDSNRLDAVIYRGQCNGCNSHTDTAGSLPTAYRHDIVESRNLRLVGMCEQGPGSLEAIALHESSEG